MYVRASCGVRALQDCCIDAFQSTRARRAHPLPVRMPTNSLRSRLYCPNMKPTWRKYPYVRAGNVDKQFQAARVSGVAQGSERCLGMSSSCLDYEVLAQRVASLQISCVQQVIKPAKCLCMSMRIGGQELCVTR